jgi:hypothetical protein
MSYGSASVSDSSDQVKGTQMVMRHGPYLVDPCPKRRMNVS